MFWSFLLVLKLGVYVCLVKSLLILSFYLSNSQRRAQELKIWGVKRL